MIVSGRAIIITSAISFAVDTSPALDWPRNRVFIARRNVAKPVQIAAVTNFGNRSHHGWLGIQLVIAKRQRETIQTITNNLVRRRAT
jgi:hypothetical protein